MLKSIRTALVFLAAAAASPALSQGYPPPVGGDPAIDAQWAAQLLPPPAVHGTVVPIDLSGRTQFRELPRGYVVLPQGYRAAPSYRVLPPGYRLAPRGYAAAPQGFRVLPRDYLQPRQRVQPARAPAAPKAAATSRQFNPAFLPAVVDYETEHAPGTIIINPRTRYLYLVQEGGTAIRYGIGVGRDGFGWSGEVKVARKAEWPSWTPPAEMRKRQPDLPITMAGGPDNPLGARALYLHRNGKDTLYRIHGSNEPWTIGQAVSSGCFRMRNEDVIDLYNRVKIGAKVVVL